MALLARAGRIGTRPAAAPATALLMAIAWAGTTAEASAAPPVGEPGWSRCTIDGTAGADRLVGTPGDDVICAGAGADHIVGAGGSDVIYGGTGPDTVHGSDPDPATHWALTGDRIYGGDGDDAIWGYGGRDSIEGGGGADHINAGADGGSIDGGYRTTPRQLVEPDGDDVIYGGDGDDFIDGGDGDDHIRGGASDALNDVDGGPGDDVLLGDAESFADWFDGGQGDDIVWPNPLRLSPLGNHATGGAGNDVLITVNGVRDFYDAKPETELPQTDWCTLQIDEPASAQPDVPLGVQCRLPWPRPLGGLDHVFNLTVTASSDGTAEVGGDFGGLASLTVEDWAALQTGNQGAVESDVTLVDKPPPGLDPRIAAMLADWTW